MADRPRNLSNRASALWTVGATVVVLGIGYLLSSVPEFAGFLVVLPAIAAGLGTVRQTAWVSIWTVAASAASIAKRPPPTSRENIALVLFAIAFGVFAVWLCNWRLSRAAQTARLRSAAIAMQRHLVRALPQVTEEVLLAGVYEPMPEENLVGGDIYDIMETAYGTRVILADVEGKGLPALGAAMAVVGSFREAAHRESTLTGLVEALEQAVIRQNLYAAEAGEPQRFVTALVLDVDGGPEVQAVNCGHLPPYVLGPEGVQALQLEGVSVPLGLADLVDEPRTVSWFPLQARETLLLFTDGLAESRARDGSFFPLEEHLAKLDGTAPAEVPAALWREARAFTDGRQDDDIAVLALRRNPMARHSTSVWE